MRFLEKDPLTFYGTWPVLKCVQTFVKLMLVLVHYSGAVKAIMQCLFAQCVSEVKAQCFPSILRYGDSEDWSKAQVDENLAGDKAPPPPVIEKDEVDIEDPWNFLGKISQINRVFSTGIVTTGQLQKYMMHFTKVP